MPLGWRSDHATDSPVPDVPGPADLSVLGPAYASPPPPLAETSHTSEMQKTWRVQRHFQEARTQARAQQKAAETFRRLVAKQQVRMRAAAIAVPSKFPPCTADASPDAAAAPAAGPAATAAPAPAPAPVSPGVAVLRREMAGVKGQPHLMSALETMVKAAEKQKRRREASGGAQQPGGAPSKPNRNMIFGGPPGTGKTSSVEMLAKVLAAPEVGVLQHANVTVLNKTTQLPSGTVPVAVGKMFEKAKGGILFLDEVHKRTDSPSFVDALVTLLTQYEGEVMVVIAGYQKPVEDWLKSKDEGMPRRFPQQYRIEFLDLEWDVLVEIGQDTLKKQGYTLSPDAETGKAFEDVMRYEANKVPSENAGGAINAVNAMIEVRDSRDDADDDDCITAADINTACPQAAKAAAARSHAAPAAATPAAAPASTAAGSSASGSHASSSAAAAGPVLRKRPRTAAAPAPPPSGSSRKRKAGGGDARAEVDLSGLSPEANSVVQAIDTRYELSEAASPITAWELLTDLHEQQLFEKDSSVYEKMEQSNKLGKHLKQWLTEAIDHINARGGESKNVRCEETPREQKLMIHGLCRKS